METIDRYKVSRMFEKTFETTEWIKKIPAINFPTEWKVQIIPPFSGAIVRFRVNDKVSVYLDGYDILGCVGEPYWEVYPHKDDVYRCPMNNVDELIMAIQESINQPTDEEK